MTVNVQNCQATFDTTTRGQTATIGRHDAVTELASGWRFRGPIGWIAWLALQPAVLMDSATG